ncbi:ABC transporter ATP-binding protein [Geminicoccaceae bacterium 1502E]|nr:ABC transporter ATP-binding protein [Geminicoccaceae bacterium 1502E]
MTEPLLEVRDLRVSFAAEEGEIEAVRGVSFAVPRHRTVALVGESGSGKTVISQAILGILPASARIAGGRILFTDPRGPGIAQDLAALAENGPERRAVRGGRISIIFQEPMSSLSPLHTIGDQIGEALMLHAPVDRGEARERVVEMLARTGFPHPARAFGAYPFELSGGLRQRAMIAMALVCRPALLIADEPTTALDVTIQAQILKLMKDLQAELDMSILFITHDLGVVANIADEMVVMYRGRIMERGATAELLRAPRHPYLKGLLRAVPRLTTPPGQRLEALREVPAEGREALRRQRPADRPAAQPDGPILEVERLRKVFLARRKAGGLREIVAVDDVSFDIMRGESFAIVGESGSGKTTASKMIMRAVTPDSGRIIFHGREGPVDVLGLDEQRLAAFRRRVQYIFQDPFGSLNPRMTVHDLIAEPLVIHGIGSAAERLERVTALLAAVGLDRRHLRRYPHSFSGGQRQRIGIARALALEPELLICDEPVSALDVSVQAQILNLLKDLQARLGLTYLFISHNLAVVRYIAQRIAVMCAGRLVELAPVEELFARPQHPYTRALLAAVPEPEPDATLDFSALLVENSSDPGLWPEPYRLGETSGRLQEIGPGHLVRMQG